MRQIVTLGSQDTLEEKTVTVCFGSDFVNVSFINFCATRKEIAQVRETIIVLLNQGVLTLSSVVIDFV